MTMRAAVFAEFGDPEVIEIRDVPIPEPGPGEVRIKVHASALNHLDLWVRRGLPFEITMPHIGGSDIAGVVEACGSGVESVPIGTRVVVDPSLGYDWYTRRDDDPSTPARPLRLIGEHTQGGLAEFCVVPAANCLELPAEVPFETAAAAALTFVTAWRGLVTRAALRAGERVLITGASGGVSTAAIQIAKLLGAEVFAVTSGAENVERVSGLGADHVYDRLAGDWGKRVGQDSAKLGVDVVLDSVGVAVWNDCMKALAVGGRLVTYGATSGAKVESDVRAIFWKQISIHGSTMGTPEEFREVMQLVFSGKLRPIIQQVMPLQEVRTAHELLESGAVFGKLVVTP